jgi:hypothetical protein
MHTRAARHSFVKRSAAALMRLQSKQCHVAAKQRLATARAPCTLALGGYQPGQLPQGSLGGEKR